MPATVLAHNAGQQLYKPDHSNIFSYREYKE